MKRYSFVVLFLFASLLSFSNVRLPAVLSSNMVLQQRSNATLWGWANPGEKIAITTSWNNHTDTVVTSRDAAWKMSLFTPKAGGPYTISFKGADTVTLNNVMIGEVWVCSGQSNMEWSSDQTLKQIIDELPASSNANIRLFNVPKTTSTTPQDDLPGDWEVCSPESLKGFSAVAYFFGKKLQAELNVPIGLVASSWGGTPAEVWTPATAVTRDPQLQQAAARLQPAPWWPHEPGKTYNAMIYPLTNLAIGGAIWYQGESNTLTARTYSKLFKTMIGSWRAAWEKDFPFYYVQIAPFAYGNTYVGALLREQQAETLSLPKTGMVVITDLVDDTTNIHPQNKKDVGIRLANLALGDAYHHNPGAYKSPMFKSMETAGGKATLFFDHAPNGFMTTGGAPATEFLIAGSDQVFLPAEVKIAKDRIIVSNPQVKAPVAVRFAFTNTAMSNLFSKEGLPVCPFRTDDWEVNTGSVDQGK